MDIAIAALAGLAIGSFLNVCIVRLPCEKSVVSPRSQCPRCGALIAWYDNIPVLSYFLLRGRCRACGAPISARYPAVEALTAALSVLLALRYGFGLAWGIYLIFAAAIIVLVLIDLDHRILPDAITLNGIWVGIAASLLLARPSGVMSSLSRLTGIDLASPYATALAASLAGIVFGGGLLWLVREVFFRLRGIEGMGFGDVKMMAMVGAFLGVPLTLLTILVGSVAGSVIGLAVIRILGKSRDYELPFGTFLGAGAIIAVLYGDELIRFYMETFFYRAS